MWLLFKCITLYITLIFILKINVENFVEKVTRPPFEAGKIS